MRIVTLVEDHIGVDKLKAAHGLSLYIEVEEKKILFDLGPSNYYIKNAFKLGIDISDVDYLFISHGHNDHGYGLNKFLKINKKAKVYLSKYAFEDHVKEKGKDYIRIGIKKPSDRSRLIYIDEDFVIDDNLSVLQNVEYKDQKIADKSLKTYLDSCYSDDHFDHEIYLKVTENQNNVVFSGCSHKGIENIITSIEKDKNISITHFIGGYHLSHYDPFDFKQNEYLLQLGDKLAKHKKTNFYSCHCTGDEAYLELKQKLKDNLHQLKTGFELIV